jgi:predicted DNA-binding WGR domain protein
MEPPDVRMEWRSPRRYYRVFIQRNLFGQWELLRVWGGVGSRRGGHVVQPVATREDALLLLQQVQRKRAQHGYVLTPDARVPHQRA